MHDLRFVLSTLALGLVVAGARPAAADIEMPPRPGLERRFATTQLIDRVDRHCVGKRVTAACALPGNAFEGGGAGTCDRIANERLGTIDLVCRRTAEFTVDRQVPEANQFIADEHFCLRQGDPVVARLLAATNATCDRSEKIVYRDRFCHGKRTGEACAVTVLRDGAEEAFAGRCGIIEERRPFNGYFESRRRFVGCEPEHPLPAPEFVPASIFRRWFLR